MKKTGLTSSGNVKFAALDRAPFRRQREESAASDDASGGERAVLMGVIWDRMPESLAEEYMDELDMLAQTAGAQVVSKELARRSKAEPSTLIGKGKVQELAEIVKETAAELVIFDEDLTPAQARNLEKATEVPVMDRTGLILAIFARRARTREAKTQVELAQLRYLLPRLTGAWAHLGRQTGGGLHLRGPGETQLETDRRMIRTRIRNLESDLAHIERVHETQRANRTEIFRFAIAGYTNAGKSTLMNVLTQAGVYEENLLFATLDSTTRALQFGPRSRALLTDTVGFIRKLPPALVASFRSTLAEIREANAILHVIDISSPSFREQMDEVVKILGEMGLKAIPQLLVFNKIDALEDDLPLRWARQEYPDAVFISAREGTNIDLLRERMRALIAASQIELELAIPASDGPLIAELHRVAEILDQGQDEQRLLFRVRLPEAEARRLHLLPEPPDGQAGG